MISSKLTYLIAESAYNATKVFSEQVLNEEKTEWGLLPGAAKARYINAVYNCITKRVTDPAVVHGMWLVDMTKEGWVYGEEYDEVKKHHPCMKEYADLELGQQTKDQIFVELLKPYYTL